MRKISELLCAIIVLAVTTSFAGAPDIRTWTSKSGATVDAAFVAVQGSTIALKKSDGSMIQIPQSGLSEADNAYLIRLLFKPKTVTFSLKPTPYNGDIVYIDAPPIEDPSQKNLPSHFEYKRMVRDPRQSTTQPTRPKQPEVRQGDTLLYKIQSISDGAWHDDSSWTVLTAEETNTKLTGNDNFNGEKRTTDNRFIIVAFRLTNNGVNERHVPTPVVVDAKGRRFNPIENSRYFIPSQYSDPYLNKIAAGFTQSYCSIYEVPLDASELTFSVETLETRNYKGTYIPLGPKSITLDIQRRN